MLEKLGLAMTLADDGQKAVDLVRERDFDLVLMDCQMPVMDGFAATEAIRRLPAGCGWRVPIVALTANTLQGDEARCLTAGMNDFLAKPYTLAQLHATLQRWLLPTGAVASAAALTTVAQVATTPAAADGAAPSTLNRAALETLRELDPAGGMQLANEVLRLFCDMAPRSNAQLRDAVATGNGKVLGQVAHALKSSAANVGAESLSVGCRELEKLAREERIDEALALADSVGAELERALAAVRGMLEETA